VQVLEAVAMVAAMGAINKEKNSMTQERLAGENSEKFDNLWIFGSLEHEHLEPHENITRQKVIDYLRKTLALKEVILKLKEIDVAGVIDEFMKPQNVNGELMFNHIDYDQYIFFLGRLEPSINNPNFSPPQTVLPDFKELYEWKLKNWQSSTEDIYPPYPYYSQEELNFASIPQNIRAIVKNAWWGYRWHERGGKCLHGYQIFVDKCFDLKLSRNGEDQTIFIASTQPKYKHEVVSKKTKFRKTFLGLEIPGTENAEAIIQVESPLLVCVQSRSFDKQALVNLISIAYENPVTKYKEYPPFVQEDTPGGGAQSCGFCGYGCGYGCH